MGKRTPHKSKYGFHPCLMSPEERYVYRKLKHIHSVCYNSKNSDYKYYGGRGLMVDPRYSLTLEGHMNLYNDLRVLPHAFEPGRSIDRENNNLGYLEGNLRWATRSEQNSNQRKHKVSAKGRAANSAGQNRPEVKAKQRAAKLGKKCPAISAGNKKRWAKWRLENGIDKPCRDMNKEEAKMYKQQLAARKRKLAA